MYPKLPYNSKQVWKCVLFVFFPFFFLLHLHISVPLHTYYFCGELTPLTQMVGVYGYRNIEIKIYHTIHATENGGGGIFI